MLFDGTMVGARAIVRLIPSARWDAEWLLRVKYSPLRDPKHTGVLDSVEQHADPHTHMLLQRCLKMARLPSLPAIED